MAGTINVSFLANWPNFLVPKKSALVIARIDICDEMPPVHACPRHSMPQLSVGCLTGRRAPAPSVPRTVPRLQPPRVACCPPVGACGVDVSIWVGALSDRCSSSRSGDTFQEGSLQAEEI